MNIPVLSLMVIHAVFFALWFVAQQALYALGISSSVVLFLSGLSAFALAIISLAKYRRLPPRTSWKWFSLSIIFNLILAEFLVRVTEIYGASLGANAMGLAPAAAIFVGWLLLKEVPGRLGILGIVTAIAGVYLLHFDLGLGGSLLGAIGNVPVLWFLLALGIAFSAGISLVVIKPAIQMTDSFMAPGLTLFVSFGVYGLIKGLLGGDLGSISYAWQAAGLGWIIVLMAGFGISNWAASAAYRYAYAASVGALKRLSAPVAVLLAWLVFGTQGNMLALVMGSLVLAAGALFIGFDKKEQVFS